MTKAVTEAERIQEAVAITVDGMMNALQITLKTVQARGDISISAAQMIFKSMNVAANMLKDLELGVGK